MSSLLSHVLLDTVGTEKPLGVHHMRQRARLPAHDVPAVLKVIRKVGGHLRRVFAYPKTLKNSSSLPYSPPFHIAYHSAEEP